MGRVFTLNFQFEGRPCNALVNLRDKGYDMTFFVHYYDKEVHTILPGGNLEFSLTEGLRHPTELSGDTAYRLVGHTVDAIAHFLKQEPA